MQLSNYPLKIDLIGNLCRPARKPPSNSSTTRRERLNNPSQIHDYQRGSFVKSYYLPAESLEYPMPIQQKTGYQLADQMRQSRQEKMKLKVRQLIDFVNKNNFTAAQLQTKLKMAETQGYQKSLRDLMDKLDQVVKHILQCGGESKLERQHLIPVLDKTKIKEFKDVIPRLQNHRQYMSRHQLNQNQKKKQLLADQSMNISMTQGQTSIDQSYAVSDASGMSMENSQIYARFFDLLTLRKLWRVDNDQILQQVRKILVNKFLGQAQKDIAHKRRVQLQAQIKAQKQKKKSFSLANSKPKEKRQQIDKLSKISKKKVTQPSILEPKKTDLEIKRQRVSSQWIRADSSRAPGLVYDKTLCFKRLFEQSSMGQKVI